MDKYKEYKAITQTDRIQFEIASGIDRLNQNLEALIKLLDPSKDEIVIQEIELPSKKKTTRVR